MLSVEPWLVERPVAVSTVSPQQVSVLSVEPWLVEPDAAESDDECGAGFSALCRAVVGGTI